MLPLGSISCPEGVFHADYREVFHFLTPAKGRDFTLPQEGITLPVEEWFLLCCGYR